MRNTPGHAYGYSVQLWREGDKLFGLFSAVDGPAEDTPVGLLENVQFDPANGKLSFTAKLSVAALYMGHGKQEPTHDVFTFKGLCLRDVISGVLTHEETHQANARPVVTRIRLKTVKKPGHALAIEASSYDEWKAAVDPILKIRGPKW